MQGHKSATCPDKDKCRLCRQPGHFARNCPNPWGTTPGTSGAESGVTVADRAVASVPDPGVVDDGSVVDDGGGLGPKSVEAVARSGDSMEIENDGDDPDEAFHDASDHEDPSQGPSQSILHENNVLAETSNGILNEMGTEKDIGDSSLNESLNSINEDILIGNGENLNENNGRVLENSSCGEESNVEHRNELSDNFSQDAQRLPESPEIQLMDTSEATLKRKKSELAFKEVPSGRSRSRFDGPQRKKAGPSSSPSPVRGFTRGCRLWLQIALVGFDLILYFFLPLIVVLLESHPILIMAFVSLNVNGLRDANKRMAVLQWLGHLFVDFACLQETHSLSSDECTR